MDSPDWSEAHLVYTTFNGETADGTLAAAQQFSLSNEGWYTLRFDEPALVAAGETFSIVVRLTMEGASGTDSIVYVEASDGGTDTYSAAMYAGEGSSFAHTNDATAPVFMVLAGVAVAAGAVVIVAFVRGRRNR